MKANHKLAVLLSLGALLPLAGFANTPEQTYLETSSKAASDAPVPVAVVSPRNISPDYAGTSVELKFTVDATGQPSGFTVVSSPDAMIARVVADAVSKWRFKPAQHDGTPVATKVLLPVHIVDGATRIAANE
ncbi:MAG TPA: TonB family protein [Opitutus sp.]|nr:TonB family protein [Opitutus sp.]